MATWYVRPDTSHSGTRNGTSYATAWGGWSEVVWGVGGVVGGDTLYVCGTHSYAAAITVGAHGGSSLATRCTISGSYTSDPGSLTFTTNGDFLQNDRAWTRVTGLTINAATTGATNNNCIFHTGTADNCLYDFNVLNGSATAVAFSFYGETGHHHLNVEIADNTFNGGGGANGGAIAWLVSTTSAASTLTNITVQRNTFRDVTNNNNNVIGFRTEDDTDASSVMTGIVIDDNDFLNTKGVVLRLYHGHATLGIGGTLYVRRNIIVDAAISDQALGGAIHPRGFSSGEISHNIIRSVTGDAGGIDFQLCVGLKIHNNEIDDVYTNNIDGNGILFDAPGSNYCVAWGNRIGNCYGKAGVFNSGVGIMFLEGVGNQAFGNVVSDCVHGLHIGAQDSGQSCRAYNNTFVNISDYGISTTATADLANCNVKNNIFQGDGYSVYDQTAVAWSAENYNVFYGFSSGASNHTLGAQSITSNPLLDASYRPMAGSPCIGAGVYIKGARHMGGLRLRSPADIGAYRYSPDLSTHANRSVATSRQITDSRLTTLLRPYR